MQNHARPKLSLQLLEGRFCVWVNGLSGSGCRRFRPPSGEALDLPDGHARACDAAGKLETRLRVSDGEQRSRVTGSKAALFEKFLNRLIEPEETKQIRNRGAILARALGELLLRELEIVAEALKCARLLDGVQILALQVFDQRHFDRQFFRDLADDYGHTWPGGSLGGAPAAFASDELITKADSADDERLDDAARADRLSELLERLFAEARTRLVRARIDEVDIDLDQTIRRKARRCRRCSRRRRRRCWNLR
jgi:hypothetical protein